MVPYYLRDHSGEEKLATKYANLSAVGGLGDVITDKWVQVKTLVKGQGSCPGVPGRSHNIQIRNHQIS